MNKFAEMHFFVAVVDAGSMSEAAKRLGTTKSMVSQRMQQLEQRLGVSLLARGRQMMVTEPGQIFYAHSARILTEVSEAENAVLAGQACMRGSLRIAAPMAFSIGHLAPMLARFAGLHPELRIDVEADDRRVNLNDENYDLAIRLGNLQDSSLVAKRMAVNRHVICASPEYLAERGTPLRPEELQDHEGLLYVHREPQGMWQLPVDGEVKSFRIRNRMRTDSGHQLLEGARLGLGLAILPTFLCADAVASGALRIVLPEFSPSGGMVSAVYRQSHRSSLKIQTLVNFLIEEIGYPPVWELPIQEQLQAVSSDRSEKTNS